MHVSFILMQRIKSKNINTKKKRNGKNIITTRYIDNQINRNR